MKKRLLFIYPRNFITDYSDSRAVSVFAKKGVFLNTSLATIAALTPPECEVTIVDENIDPIPFDRDFDLVGLTGFHFHLPRARSIAKHFSNRGIPVVCGGPSATLSHDRWRPLADVLMVGEAERTWPRFIRDFLDGRYQSEYVETGHPDLSLTPVPDFSGFSKRSLKEYLIGVVQTSRGCPYNCEFCSVHVYMGHKMRYKSKERVIQELEQLYGFGMRIVFLADDNFSAGRKQAMQILSEVRDWNRSHREPMTFGTQLSIDTVKDEEFLQLAAEAGLNRVYVGIESPNPESLKETRKYHNVKSNLLEDLSKFSLYGIMVIGSTIVGFDHDDLSIFRLQDEFFERSGIPKVHVYPLQARDGTDLKRRIVEQGRYLEWDTGESQDVDQPGQYRNLESFSIVPQQMSVEQLKQGTYWLAWRLYDLENLKKRIQTMFDAFDSSPVKNRLNLSKPRLTRYKLKVLAKVIRALFTENTRSERLVFREMLRMARKSAFPRKLEIVVAQFFLSQAVRRMLVDNNPEVSRLQYPR